jgi:gliding motility-associated-like protein
MKKVLLLILILNGLVITTKATHIVGGELNYLYLGNNDYEIRLTVYRDCYNGVPPFDDPAALGIFDSNHNLLQNILMNFISLDTLPITINSPCVIPPINVCYEVTTYIDTVNLPPIAGGYQLAYQRCCRNVTILNIVAPNSTGATYYATVPDTNIEVVNSNPIFNAWPPPFICSQTPFVFDHSATDPDGDSLYYELFLPFEGANTTFPMPQPPNNPPYANVVWNPPYSLSDMLGGTVPLTINPNTGLLTATPGPLGQFVVGMKVSEYRNGVFLSETKRDFQFNVVPCGNITVASLVAPNFSCESFTAGFVNNSVGAGSYLWDFGDPTSIIDTSSLTAPTYTYPDTGTYIVTLIAFSNLNPLCNDTSYGVVNILPEFVQTMNFSNEPCTQDVIFSSSTLLDSTNNVIFDWDFGNGLGTSNQQNPTYAYPDTGTYNVTLISYSPTNPGCNDTGTVTITIFPEFTINGSLATTACSNSVNFFGNTSYNGLYPVNYLWDFGDGSGGSSTQNPTYAYPTDGSFIPILIAYTDSPACADTVQLAVTVFPPFLTEESIIDKRCSYDIEVAATTSLDGIVITSFLWGFGDGNSTTSSNATHTYAGPGNYTVTLNASTSNGCSYSFSQTISKATLASIFLPNAFTPNGDGENDVLFVRGDFDEMELKIYNRWGEKVFESTDQSVGWDGTFTGRLAEPGVFVFYLTTKCADEPEIFKKGNVTVIR